MSYDYISAKVALRDNPVEAGKIFDKAKDLIKGQLNADLDAVKIADEAQRLQLSILLLGLYEFTEYTPKLVTLLADNDIGTDWFQLANFTLAENYFDSLSQLVGKAKAEELTKSPAMEIQDLVHSIVALNPENPEFVYTGL